jgi:chorismate dehydratase
VYLVRLLLEKAYRVRPRFVEGREGTDASAWLLIGDEALRSASAYPHSLDLGTAWHALTGLSFVFAVWAVRAEVWERAAPEVRAVHRALLASKQATREAPDAMIALARARTGLPLEACRRYLRERLCFDLGPRHLEGLRTFLQMLVDAGALASMPRLRFAWTEATGEAP